MPPRLRVDTEVFDAPWVLRALAARGVRPASTAGRPCCSAVLGDAERAAGRARRARPAGRRRLRPHARSSWPRSSSGRPSRGCRSPSCRRRGTTRVGRAEAVGAAARALGDLGAATAPGAGRAARVGATGWPGWPSPRARTRSTTSSTSSTRSSARSPRCSVRSRWPADPRPARRSTTGGPTGTGPPATGLDHDRSARGRRRAVTRRRPACRSRSGPPSVRPRTVLHGRASSSADAALDGGLDRTELAALAAGLVRRDGDGSPSACSWSPAG